MLNSWSTGWLISILALSVGCNSLNQNPDDSSQVSGSQIVLTQIDDTAPDSNCSKPGSDNLISVTGDSQANIWTTTAKENGVVQSVPTDLIYVEYNVPSLNTPITVAKTYNLTCTEDSSMESLTNAVFECNSPYETTPASQAATFVVQDPNISTGQGNQMSVEVHQVTFENPACNRMVTYQNQFIDWTGTESTQSGLNGIVFPLFNDQNG